MGERWRLDLEYGSILIHEGKLNEALRWFEKATEEAPDRATASRLASMLCREAGFFSAAEQFHARAMHAGLDETQGRFDEALIKKNRGDETAYREIIDGLLSAGQPYPAQLCKDLGMEAFWMGKWKEAQALLVSALEKGLHQPKFCTILALACKYQGKMREAVDWNVHAIAIDNRCVEAYINLGHLHYERQQWAEAKSNYKRSLTLGGLQGDVLFRLSVIALMEEDVQSCLGYCSDTLKVLGIGSNGVQSNLSDFPRLYHRIADGFLRAGMTRLHSEAVNLAATLEKAKANEDVRS
jgi:tetratricopeptide (TPR) repeat protein